MESLSPPKNSVMWPINVRITNFPSVPHSLDMLPTKLSLRMRKPREWSSMPPMPKSRSEEHTSELQSLMLISYAVFCLKQNTKEQHSYTMLNTYVLDYSIYN